MNIFRKFSISCIVLCLIAQLSACTKLYDHVFGDDKSSKKCRIISFRQNNVPASPGFRNARFYYNRQGNIDSIITDVQTGSLGASAFYFSYDKNQRLIKYTEDLGWTYPYREVHTYAYQNGGIARDSVRYIPYAGEVEGTIVKSLKYDSYGRVSQENSKYIGSDGTVTNDPNQLTFTYNNDGNLILGAASYDNKVNFLGTNKYLMFTQRDYSKNNRLGATGYNQRGLPLGFSEGVGASYGQSGLLSFGLPVDIKYNCK